MKTYIKIILVGVIATNYSCGGGLPEIENPTDFCENQVFTLQQAKDSIQRGIKPGYYDSEVEEMDLAKTFTYQYDVEPANKLDFSMADYDIIIYTLTNNKQGKKDSWVMGKMSTVYMNIDDIPANEKSGNNNIPVTKGSDYKHSYEEAKEIRNAYFPDENSREYIIYSKLESTCSQTELYLIKDNNGINYNLRIEIDRAINDKYAVLKWES